MRPTPRLGREKVRRRRGAGPGRPRRTGSASDRLGVTQGTRAGLRHPLPVEAAGGPPPAPSGREAEGPGRDLGRPPEDQGGCRHIGEVTRGRAEAEARGVRRIPGLRCLLRLPGEVEARRMMGRWARLVLPAAKAEAEVGLEACASPVESRIVSQPPPRDPFGPGAPQAFPPAGRAPTQVDETVAPEHRRKQEELCRPGALRTSDPGGCAPQDEGADGDGTRCQKARQDGEEHGRGTETPGRIEPPMGDPDDLS